MSKEIQGYLRPNGENTSVSNNGTTVNQLAVLTAVVAGSLAAGKHLPKVVDGTETSRQLLVETGKAAITAGVTAAVGGMIASRVGKSNLLQLGTLFVAGAAMSYGIRKCTYNDNAETEVVE